MEILYLYYNILCISAHISMVFVVATKNITNTEEHWHTTGSSLASRPVPNTLCRGIFAHIFLYARTGIRLKKGFQSEGALTNYLSMIP